MLKSQIGFAISAGLFLSSAGFVFGQQSASQTASDDAGADPNVVNVQTLTKEELAREVAAYKPKSPWQVIVQEKAWALECVEEQSDAASSNAEPLDVDAIFKKEQDVAKLSDEEKAAREKELKAAVEARKCRLTHTGRHDVVDVSTPEKNRRKKIFEMTVDMVKPPKSKKEVPVAIIKTPMNIILPEGLSISIDGAKPLKFLIRSCHVDLDRRQAQIESSCLVPFQITGKVLQRFKSGGALQLKAKRLDGKVIDGEISLFGFSKNFDRLVN